MLRTLKNIFQKTTNTFTKLKLWLFGKIPLKNKYKRTYLPTARTNSRNSNAFELSISRLAVPRLTASIISNSGHTNSSRHWIKKCLIRSNIAPNADVLGTTSEALMEFSFRTVSPRNTIIYKRRFQPDHRYSSRFPLVHILFYHIIPGRNRPNHIHGDHSEDWLAFRMWVHHTLLESWRSQMISWRVWRWRRHQPGGEDLSNIHKTLVQLFHKLSSQILFVQIRLFLDPT